MNPRAADDYSGITNLVHGNESDARELRANLAVFARQTDNPDIRKLVSNVLARPGTSRTNHPEPSSNAAGSDVPATRRASRS